MKVAILSPVFDPTLNYNETLLAREFADRGNLVRVFTSTDPVFGKLSDSEDGLPYTISRTTSFWRLGGTFCLLGSQGLRELDLFKPDLVLAMVPDRGLTAQYLKASLEGSKIISYFGDLAVNTKRPRLKWLLKSRWYRRAFKKSDLIAVVTPETKRIIRSKMQGGDDTPLWVSGLPYDSTVFYAADEMTPEVKLLRKRVDHVIGVITRINPSKPIVKWIKQFEDYMTSHSDTGLVIAGVGDCPLSEALKEYIAKSAFSKRVLVLPVLDEVGLRSVYAGIDISVWFQASIGIQQSLASGVPVVAPDEEYLSHLLIEGVNAEFYRDHDMVGESTKRALQKSWNSNSVSASVNKYEKSNLVDALLSKLAEL